jgi:WD40-like Beta Propeller Repeat
VFIPAYVSPGKQPDGTRLVMFPPAGEAITVPLSPGMMTGVNIIGSSRDGHALYGETAYPGEWGGLTKFEFRPARQTVVPGSAGLGRISSLSLAPSSRRILVSASTMKGGKLECGDFEIDPESTTRRTLRVGIYPECGGPISQDGGRELHTLDGQLSILELRTGANTPVASNVDWASWSPDGRWIAAVSGRGGGGHILLFNAMNTREKRSLGTGHRPLVWSPDSKHLLLAASEVSCLVTLYGQSLQVLNVETGKRSPVGNSHCRIASGSFAWVNADIVQ